MGYNILTVDRLGLTRLELLNVLKRLDPNILEARSGAEARSMLARGKTEIHAAVWAINGIDFEEYEAIKQLKKVEFFKSVPLMVISAFSGKSYMLKAIEAGAVEYLVKPYDTDTAADKIYGMLGIPPVKRQDEKTEQDMVIFNFNEMFSREIKAAARGAYPLAVILAAFQLPDPNSAHSPAMDEITSLAVRVIKTSLRETDTIFCYGSSSFIMLLPFTDREGADIVQKRVVSILKNHTVIKRRAGDCKISIACVTFPDDGRIQDKLLEKLETAIDRDVEGKNV